MDVTGGSVKGSQSPRVAETEQQVLQEHSSLYSDWNESHGQQTRTFQLILRLKWKPWSTNNYHRSTSDDSTDKALIHMLNEELCQVTSLRKLYSPALTGEFPAHTHWLWIAQNSRQSRKYFCLRLGRQSLSRAIFNWREWYAWRFTCIDNWLPEKQIAWQRSQISTCGSLKSPLQVDQLSGRGVHTILSFFHLTLQQPTSIVWRRSPTNVIHLDQRWV